VVVVTPAESTAAGGAVGARHNALVETTWRRWAYLVLGGALLVPFGVLGSALAAAVPGLGNAAIVGVMVATALVGIPAAGLVPVVRVLEVTATRELVGGPAADLPPPAPGPPWPVRLRAAAWFTGHVLGGAVVSVASIAAPAAAGALVADATGGRPGAVRVVAVALAVVAAVAVLHPVTAGLGAVIARAAPAVLGPSPAERLAALERRAEHLAERNRLARELHDSVGHALSIVSVQAGAAERVLDSDPELARTALAAIAESARAAAADLDHVLGLLRDDEAGGGADGEAADRRRAPAPTLEALDDLLRRTRSAGVDLDARVTGPLGGVPRPVSAEAYRIVQESVTNAVRHAGDRVRVTVRLDARPDAVAIEVANPLPPGTGRAEPGRGLRGIRERVTILRGTLDAGPRDGEWRVAATLPVSASGGRAS
jgi:signal transduction histidine kinase